jgi:ABC-type glutathione transport system ATPase component
MSAAAAADVTEREVAAELRDVSVRFTSGPPWARTEVDAVKAVSLGLETGETLGLVGESGSGKTTVGRLLLGLVRPTHGEVRIGGEPIGRRRRAGVTQVVLQNPDDSLDPRMRVGRSLAEPLAIAGGTSRADRDRRAREMLDRVGLLDRYADRYPHELSGGQRQRVAIGRALITHPKLIVFDEAVTALDVSVQAQILNLIRDLQDERRFASLFISHDLAVVRYVASRIAVMHTGEIVESASASAFYGRPRHPYSQQLAAAAGLERATGTIDSPQGGFSDARQPR